MNESTLTITLRPGDPPPFWDGPWHPQGQPEGAVMVKPLAAGQNYAHASMGGAVATATVPQAPVVAPPVAPAMPARPEAVSHVPERQPVAEPPLAPPASEAAAPRPAQAPRSYVSSLFSQGPIGPAPGAPASAAPEETARLRQQAKQLQSQGQLGAALQALGEALRRSPGEAATYAQIGSLMLAGKAWEDAAHHFLVAYMLAPREPAYGRLALHAAWVLGYVGWAYQIASALYKLQPAPELAEIGRQAQGWLKTRPAAYTALCPACRTNALTPEPAPCGKCGGAVMGAPANAVGFAGLKLLQQTTPTGRLFAGACCASCRQDTVLLVTRGGPQCLSCRGTALAVL